jgi:hypothetical protein
MAKMPVTVQVERKCERCAVSGYRGPSNFVTVGRLAAIRFRCHEPNQAQLARRRLCRSIAKSVHCEGGVKKILLAARISHRDPHWTRGHVRNGRFERHAIHEGGGC